MEKKEAFNLVAQVCAIYKGSLEEHKAIQTALEILKPIEEQKEEVRKK